MDKNGYMVGQYWVEYLIKKFGKKKIIRLVKSYENGMTEKRFAAKFNEIYGFKYAKSSFSKLIK